MFIFFVHVAENKWTDVQDCKQWVILICCHSVSVSCDQVNLSVVGSAFPMTFLCIGKLCRLRSLLLCFSVKGNQVCYSNWVQRWC